jgi:hypothetical protein
VLEFKDGRIISFKICEEQEVKAGEKSWIESIEESHHVLGENPIPDWLHV